MKISEASITIEGDGMNHLYEYPSMPLVDLIGKLFEIYGARIEVILPDAKKAEFERIALHEWHTTHTELPKYAFVQLWVDKETEKYFAVQRIHKAFNEYVIAGMTKAPENPIADQSFKDKFPGTTIEDLEEALTIRKDENPG